MSQPRPCPGGVVFHAGGLLHRPFSPSLFPRKYPLPFAQLQVSTQVIVVIVYPSDLPDPTTTCFSGVPAWRLM